jgi:hypothetical protein
MGKASDGLHESSATTAEIITHHLPGIWIVRFGNTSIQKRLQPLQAELASGMQETTVAYPVETFRQDVQQIAADKIGSFAFVLVE